MKRYIDVDDLIKHYEAMANIAWNEKFAPSSWRDAYIEFVEHLEELPAADAVPRAEVDKLIYEKKILFDEGQVWHDAYKDAMAMNTEVTSGIFAEIEQEILRAIDNNLQRMTEQDEPNEIWRMCLAKKNTLCGIYDFIGELKKKYHDGKGAESI